MTRIRMLVAVALLIAVPAVASAATVTAPKSGSKYEGPSPADVLMQISGRSVEIVAFSFKCGKVTGRTSVNDFRLKRTDKGYRFNADASALVGYSDDKGDENGKVHVSGRFALNARSVRGHLRVKSKRCGDTGAVNWRASRSERGS